MDDYSGEDRRSNSPLEEVKSMIRDMQESIHTLDSKVESQIDNTKDLIEAWRTTKGIATFIKWFASLAISITAIIGFIKGWHIK